MHSAPTSMHSIRITWHLWLGVLCFPVMAQYLNYKAGSAIIDMIRDESVKPEKISVFAAPAGGPKWFACVGFDRALMQSGLLHKSRKRVLLVGASAGAWRCLAMACADPLSAYERLRRGYSRNVFTAADTPRSISHAFRENIEHAISDADIDAVLNHEKFDLAVHTVRAKGPAGSERRTVQGIALLAAFCANMVSERGMDVFYERCVFYSGPRKPVFLDSFRGASARLTRDNLRMAALATGSLPYIMSGVADIPEAPEGVYRDGGLSDYQLNQDYAPGPESITLFCHYQERIVPGWFDKMLSGRKPPMGSLDRVLQIHPTEDFLRLLPDGRLPDRNDFKDFVDNPDERIRRWDEVSEVSTVLGTEFLEDIDSSRISKLVEPL